jgi:hypothetical protein
VSLILAAVLAGASQAPPPPGLLIGFYRMLAFQQRARELNCGAGDLDDQLAELRRQLIDRYGKKTFSPPKQPPTGLPGTCLSAITVYRVNLVDFRKEVAAALATPISAVQAKEKE